MTFDQRSVSTRSSPIPGVPYSTPPQLPISQLPLVSALLGGEMIPMVQNGITVRASASLVGGVGAAPAFTQKVNSLYYQVSGTSPQAVFPLSTPDLFGNTYQLGAGPSVSIEVSSWGVRLTPTIDFLVDYNANTITLINPAGVGQTVVIDFFAVEPGAAFAVEAVNVTATNTLAALAYQPDGKVIVVFVNHMAFFAVGSPPSFSLSGKTITWNSHEPISINPGDNVIVVYTHVL